MSKIEQLIDEIEEFVDGCKPATFSRSNIVVPKDQLYELLTELRLKTPDEIKRYQKIIAQKDKIINDAQAQAEQMVKETTDYCNALVDEHEIMLKAYEKAEQTINDANAQAQEIVAAANQNAEEVRVSALTYTQSMIGNVTEVLERSLDIARKNSEGLIGGLTENLNILTDNSDAITEQLTAKREEPKAPAAAAVSAPEYTAPSFDEAAAEAEFDKAAESVSEDIEDLAHDTEEAVDAEVDALEDAPEEKTGGLKGLFSSFGKKKEAAEDDFDDIE
ncbi:MAG: ATPase [Lachnospiraceae bacterium]|nr:ATPase [Lachnospiraceae bacterium]